MQHMVTLYIYIYIYYALYIHIHTFIHMYIHTYILTYIYVSLGGKYIIMTTQTNMMYVAWGTRLSRLAKYISDRI